MALPLSSPAVKSVTQRNVLLLGHFLLPKQLVTPPHVLYYEYSVIFYRTFLFMALFLLFPTNDYSGAALSISTSAGNPAHRHHV